MFKDRKILSLFIALIFMLPIFSSCKKENDEEKKEIFGAKEFTTVDSVKGEPFGGLKKYGDDIFFFSRGNENGVVYYLNKVSSDGIMSDMLVSKGEFASGFDFDGDGNIVFISSSLSPEDDGAGVSSSFVLKKITPDGDTVEETDITAEISKQTSEYFYPENLAVDADGNFIIDCYDSIAVLDKDKNYLFGISVSGNIRGFVKVLDGVYVTLYGEERYCDLRKIDMESKALGENIDVVGDSEMSYNFTVYGGETKLYISDKTSLYSFDIESGEKKEILNFSDAGVPGNGIKDIIEDGGGFICIGYSEDTEETFIAKLTPVDASEISDKTEIVLAGSEYNIGPQLENQVIKFNGENGRYRIKIKKYTVDDFYEKLGLEMAAGNIPDILISDPYTQFESYAEKGLFEDLYEFIDSDPELKREDFLPNLMAAMETDGKLLRFAPEFRVLTAIGKTSIFGEDRGLDFDRLNEIMKSRSEGTQLFTATSNDDVLITAMRLCGDEFIDYKAGKCDFKSEYFLRLLEFAKSFPETAEYESDALFNGFADERALMLVVYMKDFSDIFWNEHQIFGEETTAVGFPTFSGTGSAFDINECFSILSSSENREGAWEFIRTLLKKEYQDKTDEFPVRLDSLKEKAEREAKSFDPDAERFVTVGDMTIGMTGYEVKEKMTDADIDKVMDVINSTVSEYKFDGTVIDIVFEEAGAYFSGSRSAEETVEIIQNRVETYLSEIRA